MILSRPRARSQCVRRLSDTFTVPLVRAADTAFDASTVSAGVGLPQGEIIA